jgi:hypothetical protein
MMLFKYPLPTAEDVSTLDLPMPAGARILSLQVQRDTVCLWAMVDPNARETTRRLCIRETGQSCEGLSRAPFLGTFQLNGGTIVGHVFDLGEVQIGGIYCGEVQP